MSKKRKNSNYNTKKTLAQSSAPTPERNNLKYALVAFAVLAVIVATVLITVANVNIAKKKDKDPDDTVSYSTPKIGTGGACEYLGKRDLTGRDIKYVKMDVEGYGSMVILLDATTAPITVNNFVKLVEEGFYDGLTFHRVMEGFMIQGGCPKGDGTGNSGERIYGEFDDNGFENDLNHVKGVISMARGSYSYDSASCQFFICNATSYSVSASLDGQYAAFGYVVAGLDIVDEITRDSLKAQPNRYKASHSP